MSSKVATVVSIADPGGRLWSYEASTPTKALAQAKLELASNPALSILICIQEVEGKDGLLKLWASNESILAALHGRGIFLTRAAQDLVRLHVDSATEFVDFGVHFGDGDQPAERVYGISTDDVPRPIIANYFKRGNCPRTSRSFVGRVEESDDIIALLEDRQLVTIVGPPGVGKSALALSCGRRLQEEFKDGVWFFQVDDCLGMNEFVGRIANEKALVGFAGAIDLDAVIDAVADQDVLLILDGCDSLREPIASFCRKILSQSSSVTILATANSRLDVAGEFLYALHPFSLDSTEEPGLQNPAVKLFYHRAEEAGVPLPEDAATANRVRQLCSHVEGLPIAIEYFAGLLRQIPFDDLETNVRGTRSDTVYPGADGGRSPLERALDQNFNKLADRERRLLTRLAMFGSAWTFDSLEELLADEGLDPGDLKELHGRLVDLSWIAFNIEEGSYRILKTLRAFLLRVIDLDQWRSHVRSLLEVLKSHSRSVYSSAGSSLLERQYTDFLLGFESCLKDEALRELAGQYLQGLTPFWSRRNRLDDAEAYCTLCLELDLEPIDHLRAEVMLSIVQMRRGRYNDAYRWCHRSRRRARRINHSLAHAAALANLAMATSDAGRHQAASRRHRHAISITRQTGDINRIGIALCNAAKTELVAAQAAPTDSAGHIATAEQYLAEVEVLNAEDPACMQALRHNRALHAMLCGNLKEAEDFYLEAIQVCNANGIPHETFEALCGLARISLMSSRPDQSANYIGLAREILHNSTHALNEQETEQIGRIILALRNQIGQERCEKQLNAGSLLKLESLPNQRVSF